MKKTTTTTTKPEEVKAEIPTIFEAKAQQEEYMTAKKAINSAVAALYSAECVLAIVPPYAEKMVKFADKVSKAECTYEKAASLLTEAHKAETEERYTEAAKQASEAEREAEAATKEAFEICESCVVSDMLKHLLTNAGNGSNFRLTKAACFGERTVYKRYTELYTKAMQTITSAVSVKGSESNLSNSDIEKALVFVNEAAETLCYLSGLKAIHFGVKHIRAFLMTAANIKTDKAGSGKSEITMKAENALRQHIEKDLHNVLIGAPRMECVKGNAKTAANYAKQEAAKREEKAAAAVEAAKKEAKAENELKTQLIEAQKRNKRLFGAI